MLWMSASRLLMSNSPPPSFRSDERVSSFPHHLQNYPCSATNTVVHKRSVIILVVCAIFYVQVFFCQFQYKISTRPTQSIQHLGIILLLWRKHAWWWTNLFLILKSVKMSPPGTLSFLANLECKLTSNMTFIIGCDNTY